MRNVHGPSPMPFEKLWGFPWRELEERKKNKGWNYRMWVRITALGGFAMGGCGAGVCGLEGLVSARAVDGCTSFEDTRQIVASVGVGLTSRGERKAQGHDMNSFQKRRGTFVAETIEDQEALAVTSSYTTKCRPSPPSPDPTPSRRYLCP